MMDEAGYNIRLATAEDAARIRQGIKRTLSNPEGKAQRKKFDDAIERDELLVLERGDGRGAPPTILAFIEWRSRTDGGLTIRDMGASNDDQAAAMMKRLFRSMLGMVSAGSGDIQVKLRADQSDWEELLAEISGFSVHEREFSRGHWWNIWVWTAPKAQPPAPRRPGPPGNPSSGPRR